MNAMEAAVHIIISGLVQGVGYRWYAARRAEALGVTGFVRNAYDGTVEVEAHGDRSLLEELIHDLKIGPRSAHVNDLKVEWREPDPAAFTRFEIR
ncbi:MAG: acylphosphatase [Bacteroidota bacterium]